MPNTLLTMDPRGTAELQDSLMFCVCHWTPAEPLLHIAFLPTPREHQPLLYLCVFILDASPKRSRAAFVLLGLISHGIMSYSSIHVTANGGASFFLRLSNVPLYIYTTFYLYIHLLMDIWVVFLSSLLWIMNNVHRDCDFNSFRHKQKWDCWQL